MKYIKKNFIATISAVFLIVLVVTVQSCSKNDEPLSENISLPMLDVDNMNRLTVQNISIIEEAQKRLDPYTKTENGKIVLTISSGECIGISERLFRLIEKSIEITNEKIYNNELILNEGKLSKPEKHVNKPRRIKLLTLESTGNNYSSTDTYYSWGHTSSTTFNQNGARDYCQDFQNSNTIQGGVAGVLMSFIKTPPVVGVAVAIGSALLTYYQAKTLYDAASKGSITVNTTEMWGYPEQGTTTVIKDQSGKTILVF